MQAQHTTRDTEISLSKPPHRDEPVHASPQRWAYLCLRTEMGLSMPPHRDGPVYASPQRWACLCRRSQTPPDAPRRSQTLPDAPRRSQTLPDAPRRSQTLHSAFAISIPSGVAATATNYVSPKVQKYIVVFLEHVCKKYISMC